MSSCTDVGGIESATVNVSQYRGDTFKLIVELGVSQSEPVDVSEFTWLCQLRDAADAVVTDIAVDDTDAAIGVIGLSIDETVTDDFEVADYSFDLEANDGEDTRTLLYGRLRIKADVSRGVG